MFQTKVLSLGLVGLLAPMSFNPTTRSLRAPSSKFLCFQINWPLNDFRVRPNNYNYSRWIEPIGACRIDYYKIDEKTVGELACLPSLFFLFCCSWHPFSLPLFQSKRHQLFLLWTAAMQMEAALMHERLQINTPTLLLQSPFFPEAYL